MALDIEPAVGCVALRILDEEEPESERTPSMSGPVAAEKDNKAVMALCVGIGKDVKQCKKGDTVFCRDFVRHGLKVDDDTVIVEAYAVMGRVVVG